MHLSRINPNRRALGGAAGALLLLMFLPWFGTAPDDNPYIAPARKVTVTAWQGLGVIDLVLALTAVCALVVAFRAHQRGDLHATGAELAPVFVLSFLSSALIIYRLVDPIQNTVPHFGAFLGLIAAIGIGLASIEGGRYLDELFRDWLLEARNPRGSGP
jgi:hypothetical protein